MKIYIAGVGVGMGPLAFIARDLGYEVVCSDVAEQDLVEYMRNEGFKVHIGQNGDSIRNVHATSPIDWFIHTSALPADNPELVFANEQNIKVSKRDDFINTFLSEQGLEMIAIAGTHGKTNTTAMAVWSLQQAGIPVSYSIGATVSFGPFGKYDPESRYFVYEADEFDRNFLQYSPAISIITNIDYDHPDTYSDQADYDMAFASFVSQSSKIYAYSDSLGMASDQIHLLEKDDQESSTNIPGVYIRQNARLLLEMLVNDFEVEESTAIEYINSFPGASRRMEKITDQLYSDYAHHPDEIKATIAAGLELSDSVVAVYQPHQNIRQHEVIDAYTDSFEAASKIYWLPTYLSREDPDLDVLTPKDLIKELHNSGAVEIVKMDDALANSIRQHIDDGELVICMAAGDLDPWVRQNFLPTKSES